MERAGERPLFGAVMILAGMTLIGIIDNSVRLIAEHVGLWQFHFMRTCLAAPAIVFLALMMGGRWYPLNWRSALLRTVFVAGAMLLYFGALPTAPIAQVAAGLLTAPIWVLVISALFLGIPVGLRRVGAVLVGFIGVCLILRPWEGVFSFWSLMPLGAGLLYALGAITTRRRCSEEPPLALILLFFLALGLAGALWTLMLFIWPPEPDLMRAAPFFFAHPVWPVAWNGWFWIGMQAFVSILCVYLTTRGYQSAETTSVALFDYSFIVSAGLTGWLIWGDVPDRLVFLGILLIMGAGAFIVLRWERRV